MAFLEEGRPDRQRGGVRCGRLFWGRAELCQVDSRSATSPISLRLLVLGEAVTVLLSVGLSSQRWSVFQCIEQAWQMMFISQATLTGLFPRTLQALMLWFSATDDVLGRFSQDPEGCGGLCVVSAVDS